MLSASCNCSRIDAVKATANQLKLETAKNPSPQARESARSREVATRLQELDDTIKAGDARKAEDALSGVRAAVRAQQASPEPPSPTTPVSEAPSFRTFLAYA